MKKIRIIFLLLALVLSSRIADAQVTFGSDKASSPYSVLELDTKTVLGGLRMPQLTAAQITTLTVTLIADGNASGLTVFNTTTNCINYWNSTRWVNLCLGSADITLDSIGTSCIRASADGTFDCEFKPKEDKTDCSSSSGSIHQLTMVGGMEYASIYITDEMSSQFQVIFQENTTVQQRTAVVRIINICTNEYNDFIFYQEGGDCPTAQGGISEIKVVTSSANNKICEGGFVYAWIDSPKDGVNYYWMLNNSIVNQGTALTITRSGDYTVYAGLRGCETPVPSVIVSIEDVAVASNLETLSVRATNGGVVCNNGSVVLSTYPAPTGMQTVDWYREGVRIGSGATYTIGFSQAGTLEGAWSAVLVDGDCQSDKSNEILVQDQTGNTSMPPVEGFVNGVELGGSITVCANSSVKLSVGNEQAIRDAVGGSIVMFTWFVNGTPIQEASTSGTLFYPIPSDLGTEPIQFSVEAKESSGTQCPATSYSNGTPITPSDIKATVINGNNPAFICGISSANLFAAAAGDAYEWYKDEVLFDETSVNNIKTMSDGEYTVRYMDGAGCWSPLSEKVKVTSLQTTTAKWDVNATTPIVGKQDVINLLITPDPETDPTMSIEWITNPPYTTDPASTGLVLSPPGGASVTLKYPETTGPVSISATVKNACASITLGPVDLDVQPLCTPLTAVAINGLSNISLVEGGVLKQFVASPTGGNSVSYQWELSSVSNSSGFANVGTNSAAYDFDPATPGFYYLRVKATGCDNTPLNSQTITIYVTLKDAAPYTEYSQTATAAIFNGEFNLDTYKTTTCGPLNTTSRTNSFAGTGPYTKTYTLVGGTTTNVHFIVTDASNLLDSWSYSGNVLTLVYKSNVATLVGTNTKAVDVVALFNISTTKWKISKTVFLQDCPTCGFWANTSKTRWVIASCWDLGHTPSTSVAWNTPNITHVGKFYQWGRKTYAATKSGSTTPTLNGTWNTTAATGTVWSAAEDPCTAELGAEWRIINEAEVIILLTTATHPRTNTGTYAASYSAVNFGIKIGTGMFLQRYYRINESGTGYATDNSSAWHTQNATSDTAVPAIFLNAVVSKASLADKTNGNFVRCVKSLRKN